MIRPLILAGALMAFSTASFAQSADAAYCAKLSSAYRDFAASGQADAEAAAAMSQCGSATAKSIQTLEKILTDNKVKLPPRT